MEGCGRGCGRGPLGDADGRLRATRGGATGQPLDFFGAIRSRAYDGAIRAWVDSVGIEQIGAPTSLALS
eukprot:1176107-Prorocentrum_minimum.AAC.1